MRLYQSRSLVRGGARIEKLMLEGQQKEKQSLDRCPRSDVILVSVVMQNGQTIIVRVHRPPW